jgi:hypothetical protein
VLLDECLPHALRDHLPDAVTVLKAAIEAGFDVLLTGIKLSNTNGTSPVKRLLWYAYRRMRGLSSRGHVAKIAAAVDCATSGSFIRVECGVFSRRGAKPEPPSLR